MYGIPALLLLAVALPGLNQGWYSGDTRLYAGVALYSAEHGTLLREGSLMAGPDLPYFNKPPLVLVIQGLWMSIAGDAMWATRLPTLCAGLVCVVATVAAVRRLSGSSVAALCTGVVLALTPEFFRQTHGITLDVWLAMCFSLGLACMATGANRQARDCESTVGVRGTTVRRNGSAFWPICCAGIPMGLSLLIKPLVGVIPMMAFGLWLALTGRRRLIPAWGAAVGVMVLVAAPWHVWMGLKFGDAFWNQYVLRQSIDRITSGAHGSEPWWYYMVELARSYWPWGITFALGIAAAVRMRGNSARPRIEHDKAGTGRSLLESSAFAGASIVFGAWCLLWFAGLHIMTDKTSRYMVSAYPAMAWFSGAWLGHFGGQKLSAAFVRWMTCAAPVVLVGCAIAGLAGVKVHPPMPGEWREVFAFLRDRPGAALWIGPNMSQEAAGVYLETGIWPGVAVPVNAAKDGEPPPHAQPLASDPAGTPSPACVILLRKSALDKLASSSDEVIFESGSLVLISPGRDSWMQLQVPRRVEGQRASEGPT